MIALTLQAVLDSVDERVPQLAAAEAQLVAAEAKILASRGAFDPVLAAEGDTTGAYGVSLGGSTLPGPTWSVGYGDDGTFVGSVGLTLDELGWNASRVERDAAIWSARAKEQDVAMKRLDLRAKAASSWWKWASSGAKLRVDEQLLELASDRAGAIRRQVEEGGRARLVLVDNERVLNERRDAVLSARAQVAIDAQVLSLYYRDADGKPIVPSLQQLPASLVSDRAARSVDEDRQLALKRPDLAAIEQELAVRGLEVRGARNRLLPSLSVSVEQRLAPRSPAETTGFFGVDVPLFFRKERGTLGQRRAEAEGLLQSARGLRDAAVAEVETAHAALDAALQREEVTALALEAAEEGRRLENRRFELGGTEIFTLLLREETVARARKARIEAQFAGRLAEAELERSTGAELPAR